MSLEDDVKKELKPIVIAVLKEAFGEDKPPRGILTKMLNQVSKHIGANYQKKPQEKNIDSQKGIIYTNKFGDKNKNNTSMAAGDRPDGKPQVTRAPNFGL